MRQCIIFKIFIFFLINSFLLLDISWAGGIDTVITPEQMLSAPVQISQPAFNLSFDQLCDSKGLLSFNNKSFPFLDDQAKKTVQQMFDFLSKTAQRQSFKSADLVGSDAMIVFGHYDLRIPEEAAMYEKFSDLIVTVGNVGNYTAHVFSEPEAIKFKKVMVELGVPEGKIITEPDSTNTLENLNNTFNTFKKKGINPKKIILMANPLHQTRVMATARLYYPQVEYISYSAYTLDIETMSKDKLIEMLCFGLREIRQLADYDAKKWISLTSEEREGLTGIKKIIEQSKIEIDNFLGFSIDDKAQVSAKLRNIIQTTYAPLIKMQESLEQYKQDLEELKIKRESLIVNKNDISIVDARITAVEKEITNIRIEQISLKLIDQGLYKKADPNLPSKQELFALLDKTIDVLKSEQTNGLLKKRIDEITAKEVFRQGHVVYIPELDEKLIVVTDLHGDLTSLENILAETDFENNMQSENPNMRLVFLGDYVNGGTKSLETLVRVMKLKIKYPQHVVLLRGNAEERNNIQAQVYDFWKQKKAIDVPDISNQMLQKFGEIKKHLHFSFELAAQYGVNELDVISQKLLKCYELMPAFLVTETGIVMSHSAPPNNPKTTLLDIENSDKFAYELRRNSTWTDKNSPNEVIEDKNGYRESRIRENGFLEFMRNIGGAIYIGGHVSFNANQIQYNGKMLVLHSMNTLSPNSGYKFYQNGVGSGSYGVLALNKKYDAFTANEMRPVPYIDFGDDSTLKQKIADYNIASKNIDKDKGEYLVHSEHESFKFFSDKTARLFYGLTTIAFVDHQSQAYENLCSLQDGLRQDLEKAGMGDCVAFLDKTSFHMTVTDIDPSSRDKKEDSFYSKESGISQKHLKIRLDQIETAFEKIENPGRFTARVNRLWFKRAIGTLIDFPDSSDLVKVLSIENNIKMSTKTDVRKFSGHISLGYIVKIPQDQQRFFEIFSKYQKAVLGEISFDKIDFCYFPSMNKYISLLTKDLVTGKVTKHVQAIRKVESFQTKKLFWKSKRLIGAVVKKEHQHTASVSDILTQASDPLGLRIFSSEKGTQTEKYMLSPVMEPNPFGDRPRQEVLHVLKGKLKCVFYTKDNQYIGEQIIAQGDTVLFTEAHKVFFLEDSTVLEVRQGPQSGKETQDEIILADTADNLSEGQIEIAADQTYSLFKKDSRLIGAVVKAEHVPGAKPKRFTTMDVPIQLNTFFKQKGVKGTKLYHTPVEGENPFGEKPRQEVLFILKGKVRVLFSTKQNEDIAEKILNAGDSVLFTEGHVVEFLEDTTFLEIKQGPYPISGNKANDQVELNDNLEFFYKQLFNSGDMNELIKKIEKTKLMVFDLDDTLAKTGEPVSSAIIEQFKLLLKNNVKVAIVTGAGKYGIMRRLIDGLKQSLNADGSMELLENLHIFTRLGNQGFSFDKKGQENIYLETAISKDQVENIKYIITQAAGIVGVSEKINYKLEVKKEDNEKTFIIRIGFDNLPNKEGVMHELAQIIRDIFKDKKINLKVIESGEVAVEIAVNGKDAAIGLLMDKYQVSPEKIVFFGDSFGPNGGDSAMHFERTLDSLFFNVGPEIKASKSNKNMLTAEVKGPDATEMILRLLIMVKEIIHKETKDQNLLETNLQGISLALESKLVYASI